jgi:7-carboxy-7-deazaguanine synthase
LESLKINEIYKSVQGESSYSGLPCTFIRVSGCPLRCRWCDTAYAFDKGDDLTITQVIEQVAKMGVKLVELTGGEPLAQSSSISLLNELVELGYETMIETGGSEPIDDINAKTHIVMDIKCPDSKMSDRNLYANFDSLKASDEIKFVLASRADYEWSLNIIEKYSLTNRFKVLISSAFALLDPKLAVEWMLEDKLDARFQLQMHKYIWNPRKKGV